MEVLFSNNSTFNGDITTWDLSNVVTMQALFFNATSFNQDISVWDISNVTIAGGVFRNATSFNQDISVWDMSNVTSINSMFYDATNFNQNLGNWNIQNVDDLVSIFGNSGMSTVNYTDTIVGWANRAFIQGNFQTNVFMVDQTGMTFDTSRSGGANFADAGTARAYLTGTLNWTISGDTII